MFAMTLVLATIPGPLGVPVARPDRAVIRVSGVGYPPARMEAPRGRLMARRAAEVRAVRKLATRLGLGRRATLRGFRYVSEDERPDGSVEVWVEYRRRPGTRRGACPGNTRTGRLVR